MTDDGAGRAAGGTSTSGASFDAYYFEHCCGRPYRRDDHWLRFFGGIAGQIVERIQPKRVLDAGCALGLLVEALRDRGVDAEGIDISSYAIGQVYEPVRPYCRVGSIADELPDAYDLIVSIEVLEHMDAAAGEAAIGNFCRHADDVLFSSTPGDYREPTHVNVQPPEYWAEEFARHGFFRDVDFDASFLTAWAVRFRRRRDPLPRLIRDQERRFAELAAERNQRRQHALELQHEVEAALERTRAAEDARTAAEQARAAAEDELRLVRASLAETHDALIQKVAEAQDADERTHAARAESDERSHALTHARETIRLMEQSIFWRARKWLGRR